MNPAAKRYTRRFLFWMMIYTIAVFAVVSIQERVALSNPMMIGLALAPVLPTLMALREFIIFFRAMDEVQARINAEAILIAAGIVGFVTFAWGWVEIMAEAPDIPMIWILPTLIATWGIARVFVARRYQ